MRNYLLVRTRKKWKDDIMLDFLIRENRLWGRCLILQVCVCLFVYRICYWFKDVINNSDYAASNGIFSWRLDAYIGASTVLLTIAKLKFYDYYTAVFCIACKYRNIQTKVMELTRVVTLCVHLHNIHEYYRSLILSIATHIGSVAPKFACTSVWYAFIL